MSELLEADASRFRDEAFRVIRGRTSSLDTLDFWRLGLISPTDTVQPSWLWTHAAARLVVGATIRADVSHSDHGFVGVVSAVEPGGGGALLSSQVFVCVGCRDTAPAALDDASKVIAAWVESNPTLRVVSR